MTKYLLIILLTVLVNDFEAELRLLEQKEMLQEEKAEMLVEKIPSPNNKENEWLLDSVSTKKSATSKTSPLSEVAPISQESHTAKKSRRIPSR